MGQSSTISSWWERCRRNPTAPPSSTARRTRLRQRSPSRSPGTGSTSTRRSTPASRSSCSAIRSALSWRCAPELDVLEVAPAAAPRPGVRARRGHAVGGGRQDLDGVRPQVGGRAGGDACPDPLAGRAWRTKTTLPSGARATQPPPAAMAPTSSSRSSSPSPVGSATAVERRAARPAKIAKISGQGVDLADARSS